MSPDIQTNGNWLSCMDQSQNLQYQQVKAVKGQWSGYRLDQKEDVLHWHNGTALAELSPDHCPSAFGISPEMGWLCDNWWIGRWTCWRADSKHAGSPERWLLPRRISGLVWMASFAQETLGSPYCCFSSMVTRDKAHKVNNLNVTLTLKIH